MSLPGTRAWAVVACAVGAVACGGEPAPSPAHVAAGCEAPKRVVGERCIEPGVQDDGCSAGTLLRDDGSCAPAGVLPELCPDGFEARDAGCEAVLPPEPCPKGQMAVPGDTSCYEPMPCGSAPWGDAPIDATTQFVDASYVGTGSDGSADKPWKTIADAVDAAAEGAVIAIAAGSYVAHLFVHKPVRIWGRCPAQVELVGAPNDTTIGFMPGSEGSELHGVTLRGGNVGASIRGGTDITLDGIVVQDTDFNAVEVSYLGGTSSATMTRSLIEDCRVVGIFVDGADLTVESSVIRRTILGPQASQAAGVAVQNRQDGSESGSLVLRRVLVEDNHDFGVAGSGAHLEVEGSLIRDTQTNAVGRHGRGIRTESGFGERRGTAKISGSVFERNHSAGVYVLGALATLEGVTVRDTQPASDFGAGIIVWDHHPSGMPSSDVTLRWSLLERNLRHALIVSGSTAIVEGVLVRDTIDERAYPSAVLIQWDHETGTPTTAALRGVEVSSSPEAGISVFDADVTMEGVHVDATRANSLDGTWGDAILLISERAVPVKISASSLENSARSGISAWGGPVEISGSRIACNAIALDVENLNGAAADITDAGGNTCGCGEFGTCKALSSSLEPPKPLTPGD